MLDVLFPRRNWGSPRVWQGIGWCLAIALVLAWAAPSHARQAAKKIDRQFVGLAGDVFFGEAVGRMVFQTFADFVFERSRSGDDQASG